MLRVKLVRIGKKHAPSFRVIVGSGAKITEVLGKYNPQLDPPLFKVDKERLKYWLNQGAQLSQTVESLLKGKYKFKPYIVKTETTDESKAPEQAKPGGAPEEPMVEEGQEKSKENNEEAS